MEKRTLVTIIAESILESMLVDDLTKIGARGYTLIEARGSGSRGVRNADWDQNQNIQIEIICDENVASAIVDHCQKKYYDDYAMVIYLSEVRVSRPEKF
jgi:hypothetical protein